MRIFWWTSLLLVVPAASAPAPTPVLQMNVVYVCTDGQSFKVFSCNNATGACDYQNYKKGQAYQRGEALRVQLAALLPAKCHAQTPAEAQADPHRGEIPPAPSPFKARTNAGGNASASPAATLNSQPGAGGFNVGDTVRLAGLAGTVEAMTLRKTTVRDADGTLYVIPNSQITTVANLSVGYSVATVNVSVDFSANPDVVLGLLKGIAMDVRNNEEFRDLFVADPQILGVDAVKGSEIIFPVVFKTLATRQYVPVREFRRRVRLALEENHLLPGDPNRVFSTFLTEGGARPSQPVPEAAPEHDPTVLKPQDGSPFASD